MMNNKQQRGFTTTSEQRHAGAHACPASAGGAKSSPRGFTLLIAVILTSVLLSIGLALLDVAYKQIILASSAKQSEKAFYAADAAIECALYYDQQQAAFSYASPITNLTCVNQSISTVGAPNYTSVSGSIRTTVFFVPCAGGGTSAKVTVYKNSSGATALYANGYDSCDTNASRRVERGLKITY